MNRQDIGDLYGGIIYSISALSGQHFFPFRKTSFPDTSRQADTPLGMIDAGCRRMVTKGNFTTSHRYTSITYKIFSTSDNGFTKRKFIFIPSAQRSCRCTVSLCRIRRHSARSAAHRPQPFDSPLHCRRRHTDIPFGH